MGFFDSLSKNPSFIGLAILGIGLFIFRDKISGFFSDITGGAQTAATLGSNFNSNLQGIQDITTGINDFVADPLGGLPEITLPSFNFEFPSFDFSNLFGNLFGNLGNNDGPGAEMLQNEPFVFEEGGGIDTRSTSFIPERTDVDFGTSIIVPAGDELGLGGGLSFIGGTTTFGDNLIDSLSEVLNIFPNLSASQARDALEENQGLTASQFRLINPDVLNLSSAGVDPDQILNNSSGNFSGLTPTQIAQLLTGGNINNF